MKIAAHCWANLFNEIRGYFHRNFIGIGVGRRRALAESDRVSARRDAYQAVQRSQRSLERGALYSVGLGAGRATRRNWRLWEKSACGIARSSLSMPWPAARSRCTGNYSRCNWNGCNCSMSRSPGSTAWSRRRWDHIKRWWPAWPNCLGSE